MPPHRSCPRRSYPPYAVAYRDFVASFNRGEFRACVDPLEVLYFGRGRSTFYQGLIQLAVALLQLERGMARSPRVLLTKAHALLTPYAPAYRGLDVAAILGRIRHLLDRLPARAVDLHPTEVEALGLSSLRLALHGPRARRETRRGELHRTRRGKKGDCKL